MTNLTVLRRAFLVLAGALALGLAPQRVAAQARTELLVYTTYLTEHLAGFKDAFERENPDIAIVWLRDSTGTLTSRLFAEAAAPKADVVFGLAATSMIELKRRGLLVPYAPKELAAVRPSFRDAADPPAWVGMSAWVAAICFNTREAARLGLPRPQSWSDLADPRFKGRITMPDPSSSGTGFVVVSALFQVLGEAKAWALLDALHPNVAVYEKSGTKPCTLAASGEFPVGISHDLVAADLAGKSGAIEVLVMAEGGGWEMDAAGIVEGTRKRAAAERLLDWTVSRPANELYATFVNQVARSDVPPANPHYPPAVARSMIRNDLAWAAANRDRLTAEWQRRYMGR